MKNLSFCCPERCCTIKKDKRKRSEGVGWDYVKKKKEVNALG
jgi:hypothetical protein